MKKLMLLFVSLIAIAGVTIAQPKAIGLRLGYNFEASYQHSLGSSCFLQLDAGTFQGIRGLSFNPTFNFVIAEPNWTPKGEWQWYLGPGISTGYFFGWRYYDDGTIVIKKRYDDYFYLGLSAMVGLSYTFWFPLQLSVDFRPTLIGFQTVDTDYHPLENDVTVYSDFWWDRDVYRNRIFYPNIALSVRYSFGK